MTHRCQVFVIGAGIRIPDHLTFEAIDAMKQCRMIFTILPAEDEPWLGHLYKVPVESVFKAHEHSRQRKLNFAMAAEHIMRASCVDPPVGYVARGTPLAFDTVLRGRARFV